MITARRALAVLWLGAFGCADADGDRDDTTVAMTSIGSVTQAGSATDASGDTSAASTGTGGADGSSGDSGVDGGPVFDLGDGSTGAPSCVPVAATEQTCDDVDDDCNGYIDDIDVGGDGICDCLSIALLGQPGSLASSQFVAWLTMQGTSSERIDPAAIDDAALAPYDIIIIDRLTRTYDDAEATALADWVDAGGGLMAMTGHTADPTMAQSWPNTLLAPFELGYEGALLSGPVTDFAVHPITTGLTSVTFAGGFAVFEASPNVSDVVATLPAGPVARARGFGDGKVFVWGDEWIEYDSEWSTLPEITQLWVNTLAWLRPQDLCAPPPA